MALPIDQHIMTDAELREAIKDYKFYHIIPLNERVSTPGQPEFVPFQQIFMKCLRTLELKGKRVLDIGCRDGLFSFAAEGMGAAEVVGIDHNLSMPATKFLIPYFKSQIRMLERNLYDLKAQDLGLFDIILFAGVLYHLRYPFWGLKVLRDMMNPGGELLIETAIWQGDPNNAMLFCPGEGDSPYGDETCTFFNIKGLVDTLKSLNFDTVDIEVLARPLPGGLRNRLSRLRPKWVQQVRSLLGDDPPKIRNNKVTRAVFHCRFRGHDKNSLLARYYEGICRDSEGGWV
jgi:tRNA (mo5U34)-methyltransferase